MKKRMLTLILLTPFVINTSPTCTSWERKDFETGTIHSNDKFVIDDCTCPCSGPRTSKNVCIQCGHGHSAEWLQEIEHDFDAFYDDTEYDLDFVTTHTGTK